MGIEQIDESLEESRKLTALLYSTTDAQVWAQEFMRIFESRKEDIDEGLMIGWFANAMQTAISHNQDWKDAGSVDCNMYTSLENHVAGAISTMEPFASKFSPRALPFARRALEAIDTWEPPE